MLSTKPSRCLTFYCAASSGPITASKSRIKIEDLPRLVSDFGTAILTSNSRTSDVGRQRRRHGACTASFGTSAQQPAAKSQVHCWADFLRKHETGISCFCQTSGYCISTMGPKAPDRDGGRSTGSCQTPLIAARVESVRIERPFSNTLCDFDVLGSWPFKIAVLRRRQICEVANPTVDLRTSDPRCPDTGTEIQSPDCASP